MNSLILALGSNHNQKGNMAKAKSLLAEAFGDNIKFSDEMWTKPIGIDSDLFLNCVGTASTALSKDEAVALMKSAECACGNTEELRRSGIVEMDVDLLQFGGTKYHQDDWQRDYIKTLTNI